MFDASGVVVDCVDRFETSHRPTMHIALPIIYRMLQKLDDANTGKKVCRGEGRPLAFPSIYSRELCSDMLIKLLEKQWEHPLLLVGCYLNPMFREMEFVEDRARRLDYWSKAEEFARKLVRKHKKKRRRSNVPSSIVIEGNDEISTGGPHHLSDVQEISEQKSSIGRTVSGKKVHLTCSCVPIAYQNRLKRGMKFRNTIWPRLTV